METMPNITPIIPEIFVLVMALVTLMAGVFVPRRYNISYFLAQITLIVVTCLTWYEASTLKAQQAIYLFHNSFVLDHLSVVLKLFIYLSIVQPNFVDSFYTCEGLD